MQKKNANNLIWYEICSEEDHYKEVISILAYAFEFLIREGNEYSVEVLIGDIDFVKTDRRNRITYDNLLMQMFIRRNGPHPLLSKSLRLKALKKNSNQTNIHHTRKPFHRLNVFNYLFKQIEGSENNQHILFFVICHQKLM